MSRIMHHWSSNNNTIFFFSNKGYLLKLVAVIFRFIKALNDASYLDVPIFEVLGWYN